MFLSSRAGDAAAHADTLAQAAGVAEEAVPPPRIDVALRRPKRDGATTGDETEGNTTYNVSVVANSTLAAPVTVDGGDEKIAETIAYYNYVVGTGCFWLIIFFGVSV